MQCACMRNSSWTTGPVILYYTVLVYYTTLYTIPYYTILHYTPLHYTTLYHTILYYTIPHYTTLYDTQCDKLNLHTYNTALTYTHTVLHSLRLFVSALVVRLQTEIDHPPTTLPAYLSPYLNSRSTDRWDRGDKEDREDGEDRGDRDDVQLDSQSMMNVG